MNSCREFNNCALNIASSAIKAMLYEVSAFPKPGLVTPISSGAHNDMNYFTFIDSTSSLMKYMVICSEIGFSNRDEKEIFLEIRRRGLEADKDMFYSTNGVNTHKGMIFLMGISCAAAAKVLYKKREFDYIKNVIRKMTKGIVKCDLQNKDLENIEKKNLTYGEKLFKEYGITGIRGEVEEGMPIVFNYALNFYEENSDLSNNDRLVHTLIQIMQCCEDTNIIHRHNIEVLKEVQNKAKYIIKLGGMRTEQGKKAIENMSEEFIHRNISPGGCADILAVTVFFYEFKRYMKHVKLLNK